MGKSRNRDAGHKWERDCAKMLREIGYEDVRTSRECNRLRDAQKVDLCNSDEDTNGRLPYNIQCKTLSSSAQYSKLLRELDENNKNKDIINVVFHKMTQKSSSGRFLPVGEYALLNLVDFYKMVEQLKKCEDLLTESGVELELFTSNKINK